MLMSSRRARAEQDVAPFLQGPVGRDTREVADPGGQALLLAGPQEFPASEDPQGHGSTRSGVEGGFDPLERGEKSQKDLQLHSPARPSMKGRAGATLVLMALRRGPSVNCESRTEAQVPLQLDTKWTLGRGGPQPAGHPAPLLGHHLPGPRGGSISLSTRMS